MRASDGFDPGASGDHRGRGVHLEVDRTTSGHDVVVRARRARPAPWRTGRGRRAPPPGPAVPGPCRRRGTGRRRVGRARTGRKPSPASAPEPRRATASRRPRLALSARRRPWRSPLDHRGRGHRSCRAAPRRRRPRARATAAVRPAQAPRTPRRDTRTGRCGTRRGCFPARGPARTVRAARHGGRDGPATRRPTNPSRRRRSRRRRTRSVRPAAWTQSDATTGRRAVGEDGLPARGRGEEVVEVRVSGRLRRRRARSAGVARGSVSPASSVSSSQGPGPNGRSGKSPFTIAVMRSVALASFSSASAWVRSPLATRAARWVWRSATNASITVCTSTPLACATSARD